MYNTIYTKLIIDYGVTYYGAWHLANVTGHQWSVLPSEIQVLSPLKKTNRLMLIIWNLRVLYLEIAPVDC